METGLGVQGAGLALAQRELGRVRGAEAGGTLIAVAGVHGNEPAGVEAGLRVLSRLGQGGLALRGELVLLAGNLAALRLGLRYRSQDLNRLWTAAQVARVRANPPAADEDPEVAEQRGLLAELDAVIARARGQVHLADLHTSSAPGLPFLLFRDSPRQRALVSRLHLPGLLGLTDSIEGVLSDHFLSSGCLSFTCEGGQHADPAAADAHEAVLWLTLEAAGMLPAEAAPEVARSAALLDERSRGLPKIVEVVHRHAITPEDRFVMEPGFESVAPARKGQLLARDLRGEIRAPEDGFVVLPLYQGLGSDGFFWGRAA